jgi:hypothetical protein
VAVRGLVWCAAVVNFRFRYVSGREVDVEDVSELLEGGALETISGLGGGHLGTVRLIGPISL